jgi:hypothetical protein
MQIPRDSFCRFGGRRASPREVPEHNLYRVREYRPVNARPRSFLQLPGDSAAARREDDDGLGDGGEHDDRREGEAHDDGVAEHPGRIASERGARDGGGPPGTGG